MSFVTLQKNLKTKAGAVDFLLSVLPADEADALEKMIVSRDYAIRTVREAVLAEGANYPEVDPKHFDLSERTYTRYRLEAERKANPTAVTGL